MLALLGACRTQGFSHKYFTIYKLQIEDLFKFTPKTYILNYTELAASHKTTEEIK